MSVDSPAVAPPPGNPRFALCDSLRGIAVLLVVVYHVTSLTGASSRGPVGDVLTIFGDLGPIVFFVLSGFLLYRPFVAAHLGGHRPPGAGRYARRRILRIIPAYWVALTVLAVWPQLTGVFTADWPRYYLFGQVYSARAIATGIPSAWTLSVEVSFYVLLPGWAWLVRRLAAERPAGQRLRVELAALLVPAIGGATVQVLAARLMVSQLLASTLCGECLWFALGMALAAASVVVGLGRPAGRAGALVARPSLCWAGALACLLGVAAVLHVRGPLAIVVSLQTRQPFGRSVGSIVLIAAFAVLLLAPAIFAAGEGGVPRRLLAWRPLVHLGVISYAVYLYHLTIAQLLAESADPAHFAASGLDLERRVPHLTTVVLLLATLAASVIVAQVSYRIVELPLLRRKEPAAARGRPA